MPLYDTQRFHEVNLTELQALNQPCTRIMARHDGGAAAAKAAADEAGGPENHILLAKGAKVMITIHETSGKQKVCFHTILGRFFSFRVVNTTSLIEICLVNATTGTIEDVVWPAGSSRSELPLAVLVSCKT